MAAVARACSGPPVGEDFQDELLRSSHAPHIGGCGETFARMHCGPPTSGSWPFPGQLAQNPWLPLGLGYPSELPLVPPGLPPPPGLLAPEAPAHWPESAAGISCVPSQVGLSVDADGIARLVPPDSKVGSASASRVPRVAPAQTSKKDATAAQVDAVPSSSRTAPSNCSGVTHGSDDGITLSEQIRSLAASGLTRIVIDITSDCVEPDPLEISSGEVLLRGAREGSKVRITIAGFRVTGGSLCLQNLDIFATEENRVQAGQLQCSDCLITSRNGCGVLCLQKAKVFLTDCEVCNCMRSGIGVNGKHTEIELHRCSVSKNNFSGIGVNHQARSITLAGNRIVDNCYHGVWLNTGVVAKWLGGEISGNRLSGKDGPGVLQGWQD